MRRFDLMGLAGAILGVLFLLAQQAHAQDRPTLERLREELCLKADRDGDDYRPRVCDPNCSCLSAVFANPISSCSEVTAGRFEIDYLIEEPDNCQMFDVGQGPFNFCITSGPTPPCTIGGNDCPSGYLCNDLNGVKFCSAPSLNAPAECLLDSDCPPVSIALTVALDGVVPVTSDAAVECSHLSGGTPKNINSADANECLVQAEAVSGLDCGFRCGNGLVDSSHGETCDDGNQTPGDGCDASCQIEP